MIVKICHPTAALEPNCSFCERKQSQVAFLLSGKRIRVGPMIARAYICPICLQNAQTVVNKNPTGSVIIENWKRKLKK